jgi:hypothetical protein
MQAIFALGAPVWQAATAGCRRETANLLAGSTRALAVKVILVIIEVTLMIK